MKDTAGNEIFDEINPAVPIIVDRDAPAITTVTLLAEAADNYINATENANATAIVSHNGSGGETTEYEIVASGHTCAAAADSAWTTTVPAANSETTEGDFKICVKISDSINPPAVMASSVFTIDKTAPTIDAGPAIAANTATALSPPTLTDVASLTWSAPAGVSFSNANLATSTISASTDDTYAVVNSIRCSRQLCDRLSKLYLGYNSSYRRRWRRYYHWRRSVDATVTGGATIYTWTQESGAGAITFGSAGAEDTTISADTDDSYVIRLTVQDALGNTAWDELNLPGTQLRFC